MVSKKEITSAMKTLRQLCLLEFSTSVGEAPRFTEPSSPKAILRRLGEIGAIVRNNGTFDGRSPHAEGYAICLVEQGDFETAQKLFGAIIGDAKNNILFLRPDEGGHYPSSSVSPEPGKLGYEGVYRYAVACMKLGLNQQAKALFREIVGRIAPHCYPIRLQDIRVEAIEALQNLGVSSLDGQLSAAIACRY